MEDWEGVDALMDSTSHIRSDWTINLDMKKGCPAGYEKISLSPYGDVQGCAMLFVSHGNIRHKPLSEILADMREWPHYKKRAGKCLIALDRPFIDEVVIPTSRMPVLPIPLNQLS